MNIYVIVIFKYNKLSLAIPHNAQIYQKHEL